MCELHHHGIATEDQPVGASEFIDQLVVCVTNARIYWRDHPRVLTSLRALADMHRALLAKENLDELVFGIADGFLFYNQRPLLGASLSAPRVIEPIKRLESGGLLFRKDVSVDDLRSLVELLGARPADAPNNHIESNARLVSENCTSIELLGSYSISEGEGDGIGVDSGGFRVSGSVEGGIDPTAMERVHIPRHLYSGIVAHMQDVMVRACSGDAIDVSESRNFVADVLKCLSEDAKGLMSISRYEQFDAFTFGHSIRVCLLALDFARVLTRDEETLHKIGLAALLHDVGKAWVPYEVLHKRGRLDDQERFEMERHTTYGGEILLDMVNCDPIAVAAAFGHHRTIRQQGYPRAVHRTRQSVVTKIVKICDVYEALTAVRPYKPRMSPVRAYRIMMTMKEHFEPTLLKRFMLTQGIFPVGSRVRLNTGESGRVVRQTKSLHQPVVDLEEGPDGNLFRSGDQSRLDLSHQRGDGGVAVEALLLDAEM